MAGRMARFERYENLYEAGLILGEGVRKGALLAFLSLFLSFYTEAS